MGSALDRLRDRKKVTYRDIPFCVDPDLVAVREDIEARLTRKKATSKITGSGDRLETEINDLEIELEEAKEAVLRASEWIRVRALAPDEYEALVDDHQPTKDQLREARKLHGPRANLQWNTETFPNAIIAASCYVLTVESWDDEGKPVFEKTEDQITPEFIQEMRTEGQWNSGEIATLVNTSVQMNESVSSITTVGNG